MSIMVGTGRGAGEGILIRDAETLETFEKVDTLVVDKTGTLTEGRPRLTVVVAAEGFDERYLLQVAAGLEKASEHPLAEAILLGAKGKGIEPSDVTQFQSITGKRRYWDRAGEADRCRKRLADAGYRRDLRSAAGAR